MEELTITVNIADRPYRLKIKRDEEGIIRQAVQEIEQRTRDYSESFAFNDKQDLLAMVLLHFSSTTLKLASELKENVENVIHRLSRMDHMLS
ncbi:MAG: cell division protein ZapA [Bacteroidales bacterium]|nr:cell division protein ZapA [Bacteroidales bacterium]